MSLLAFRRPGTRLTVAATLGRPLRSLKRTAVIVALSAAGSTGLFWAQPAEYSARIDIVVITVTGSVELATARDMSIDSAVQILYSDKVLGKTARTLDYPGRSSGLLDDLTIEPLINSRLLEVRITHEDAQLAFDAVNLLTQNFLDARNERLLESSAALRDTLQQQVQAIDSELTTLNRSSIPNLQRRQVALELSQQRSEAQATISAIDILPPSPGFISRQAIFPKTAERSGAEIFTASGLALALTASTLAAPKNRKSHRKEGTPNG